MTDWDHSHIHRPMYSLSASPLWIKRHMTMWRERYSIYNMRFQKFVFNLYILWAYLWWLNIHFHLIKVVPWSEASLSKNACNFSRYKVRSEGWCEGHEVSSENHHCSSKIYNTSSKLLIYCRQIFRNCLFRTVSSSVGSYAGKGNQCSEISRVFSPYEQRP
jgi:hypothetical protein